MQAKKYVAIKTRGVCEVAHSWICRDGLCVGVERAV